MINYVNHHIDVGIVAAETNTNSGSAALLELQKKVFG
jgi:hypothetical protein